MMNFVYKQFFIVLFFTTFVSAQDIEEDFFNARTAFNRGEYSQARKLYKKILDSENDGNIKKGFGYFKTFLVLGDYQEGLQELERYLKKNSDDPFLLHKKVIFLSVLENIKRQNGCISPFATRSWIFG